MVSLAEIGVVIVYKPDLKGSVSITLPEEYKRNVAGLCGDFDEDPANDLIPKGRTQEG